jgi:hypothetical protein
MKRPDNADGLASIVSTEAIGVYVFRSGTGGRTVGSPRTTTRTRVPRRPAETDLGFTWGLQNSLLLGIALVVLGVGYVALSRGSTTLAPVMLVLGYCVLVPASLLLRGRVEGSGE